MAQSVKCLILDFGSGHDFRVVRSSPMSGSALGVESARDSLSPAPPLLKKKKEKKRIKLLLKIRNLLISESLCLVYLNLASL